MISRLQRMPFTPQTLLITCRQSFHQRTRSFLLRKGNDLLSLPRESNAVAKGRVAIIKAKTSVRFIVCHSLLEALYIYYYSYFSQQLSAVDFIITLILQRRRQAERSQMTCQASGSQWVLQLGSRPKRLGSQVLVLQCCLCCLYEDERKRSMVLVLWKKGP